MASESMVRYALHDIPIQLVTSDKEAARRIDDQWRPFLRDASGKEAIIISLEVTEAAPIPPDMPAVSVGPDVTYFRENEQLVVLFPGWGRFDVRLDDVYVHGRIARAAVASYGVFEDMILIAMTPLLRRRGYYAIHAFAAAVGERALLLLGDTGAGKTTTGLSLLMAGAGLVANDTPLLRKHGERLELCAYPGLISAYPDSLARFPRLSTFLAEGRRLAGSDKISFAAEVIRPDIWTWRAQPAALVFPVIEPGAARSRLTALSAFDALQRLTAQSVEDWDAATIPDHLRVLRELVELAPAYLLRLAPDVSALPDLLLPLLG